MPGNMITRATMMTMMTTQGIAPSRMSELLISGGATRTQVEQRETERRVHEGGLHVDADQHAEPDQVDAHLLRYRRQQRNDDEGDLEIVEEEGEEEHEDIDEDQETDLRRRAAD